MKKIKKLKKKRILSKFDPEIFYLASSFFLQRMEETDPETDDMILELKRIGNAYFGEEHDNFSFCVRCCSIMVLIADEKSHEPMYSFLNKIDNVDQYDIAKLIAHQMAIYPIINGVFIPNDFIVFMEKNLLK